MLSLWWLLALGCASTEPRATVPRSEPQGSSQLSSYQFAELESLMAATPRPVAIFLHATWCQFCRNMEHTTLRQEEVIQLLNEDFYFVSFDGEQKEDVAFRGHTFRYQPKGRHTGTHELAAALGTIDNTLTYPTLVLLDEQYNIIFQHNAFLNAGELTGVLRGALERKE